MPITAYVGLPGHGKSYGVVENVILPALRANRTIVTNLPLARAVLDAEFPGADVRPFDVAAVVKNPAAIADVAPAGSVCVIDEAWRLWPQGLQGNKVPEPFRAFLAEHRHNVDGGGDSTQVVLVTQDLKQLASFARDLIEQTFRVRKLTALGMSKTFMVDVYSGAVLGANPPERLRVRQIPGKYSAKVWRFYQSHTKREGEGSGANEAAMDKRGVLWRSPLFYIGAPVGLAVFVFGIYKVWGFLHREAPVKRGASVAAGPGGSRARAGRASPAVTVAAWRVTGWVDGFPGGDVVFLQSGARSVRLRLDDYCDRDAGGYLICRWEGRQISSQVREWVPATAPVREFAVLGNTVATVSEGE